VFATIDFDFVDVVESDRSLLVEGTRWIACLEDNELGVASTMTFARV
jgi:hypothetical protein